MHIKKTYLIYSLLFSTLSAILYFFWTSSQYSPFNSASGAVLAIGHLSGFLLSYFLLIQVLIMAKIRILEDTIGKERLTSFHHDMGYFILALLIIHPLSLTIGYNMVNGPGIFYQLKDFLLNYEDVLLATIGSILFLCAIGSSVYIAKKRLRYETWYYVHLTSYIAILLTFFHQVSVGPDFINNTPFQIYWYSLYTVTFGAVVWYRLIAPIILSFNRDFRVKKIVFETDDTYSIYIDGRSLVNYSYKAGQFASLRFLEKNLWRQSHPFSFSSGPGKSYIRFTVKKLGDYTSILDNVTIGTRVVLEGPFGKLHPNIKDKNVLLIAGGVGITPLRSMLEPLIKNEANIHLLYCVKKPEDIIFSDEIRQALSYPRVAVNYIYSQHAPAGQIKTHINEQIIRQLVPDAEFRTVYLCGPSGFMTACISALNCIGTPTTNIHKESFSY